jgi:quercetin dioxygenase-like cupin family protein
MKKISIVIGYVAMTLVVAFATAQTTPPTKSKGTHSDVLRTVELTEELESVAGRKLRMRRITIQPDGVIRLHSHKGRPEVSYLLSGSIIFHYGEPEGKRDLVLTHPGDGFAEGKATAHWAENRGTVPAVLILVDIPKSK